ncbi:MAG: NDP-sugar synthase [Pyrinomonadaceae bacterium]
MQALILAGGKGTRLRPLTVYTPKPIVPFGNRPFLLTQIETLKQAEIIDVTLSLNYQPDKIEQVLDDGSEFGVKLRYLTEPHPMGTAGAYKFAADFLKTTTVVFNGDILTDINLNSVIEFHKKREAMATIVLTPVENPATYGLVTTAADGRVEQFLEKPKPDDLKDQPIKTVNAGIYIIEPKILDFIPENINYSFEYDLFPALLEKVERFFAFIAKDSYWLDIGTPERYWQAHMDLLDGKIKNFPPDGSGERGDIAHTADVDKKSLISSDCVIKPGAKIINSVLGAGVYVEEKAVVKNSVIWSHTRINANAVVTDAVIGRGCHIGRFAHVGANSVLGDKTSLTDYTQV